MATQADLDAALEVVNGDITQVGSAVQSVISAVEGYQADLPDLSSEVATLENFHAALQGDVSDIDTAESQATPTPTNASDDGPAGPDTMVLAGKVSPQLGDGSVLTQDRRPLNLDGSDPNAPHKDKGDTSVDEAVAAIPGAGTSGGAIFGAPLSDADE